MDEFYKKREEEHLNTIAAMQKRLEELEGTIPTQISCDFYQKTTYNIG